MVNRHSIGMKLSMMLLCIASLSACQNKEKESDTFDLSVLDKSKANQILIDHSPWVTTAVYLYENEKLDKSKNFINDEVAKGTVSSAQYRHGTFIFLQGVNTQTGELNTQGLITTLNATRTNESKPNGFAFGHYEVNYNALYLLGLIDPQ